MDPAVLLLPEITLNEGRAFNRTPFSQLSSADRSASQGGRDTRRLQTSPDISNRQLCPAEPRLVMGGSAPQGASRAWTTANSHQRCSNQRPVHQHLVPSLRGPVGPRAPGSPFPCGPHPVLNPLIPQLICHPCFPPWSNRMTLTPVASTSNSAFGFSPCVMAPFRCPPPLPRVYLHLLHPSSCLRLQSVTLPQLCSPDRVSRRAAQQVDGRLCATAPSEQDEEQAESGGGQQENGNADGGTTESSVSPGSLPSSGEESLAERVFEEYMAIMDALGLQIPEETTGENEEDEKKRIVAYLEKLCSDEGFIRGVDLFLNPEDSLDPLLSADPEPTDVPLRELQHEDSYPPSAESPAGTQSDTSPNHDRQNSPTNTRNIELKDGRTGSSPLRLEEPLQTDTPTGYDDIVNVFELIDSSLQLLTSISPHATSTSDAESRNGDSAVEEPAAIFPSEGASGESSNVADAQMSRNLQEGDLPSLEFSSTSSVSGSNMDPCAIAAKDSAPSFRADLLKPEECSPKNTNLTPCCLEVYAVPEKANSSFVEDDPPVDEDLRERDLDLELQASREVASSGVSSEECCETDRKCEGNLGKGVRTTVNQQAGEERRTFDGRLTEIEKTELQQELKGERDLSSHTGEENALKEKDLGESTVQREEEGPPKSGYVTRRRTRSKTLEEKLEPTHRPATRTGGKIKLSVKAQSTTEGQNLLVSSRVPNQENVSGESRRVQTRFHSAQDSVKDDQSRQESPKGLTDEINELPSVKNFAKTPHLTPTFSPETRKRHKTVAGTTTLDFYSLRSGTQVSKGKEVQEKTVEDPPSSRDHPAAMRGQSLTWSPMKRYRQDRESSEERKTRLSETETVSLSPTKRGRWRKKDEEETPGRKPTPPLRRSYRKILDLSAERETVVTRASRKRQTRLSKKLPTKYKDFIMFNRRLGKEKGKAGRGRTARRCV